MSSDSGLLMGSGGDYAGGFSGDHYDHGMGMGGGLFGGGGDGGGGLLSGIQTMGIVNALKTGNVAVDMAIAMTIPLLLPAVFGAIRKVVMGLLFFIAKILFERKQTETAWHERVILFKDTNNTNNNGSRSAATTIDNDTQNQVLIKSVLLYLDHLGGTKNLKSANLLLTSLQKGAAAASANPYSYGANTYGSNDDDDPSSRTLSSTLAKYAIVKRPPENMWHRVGMKSDFFGDEKEEVELQINEVAQPAQDNNGNNGGGGGGNQLRNNGNNDAQQTPPAEFCLRLRSKGDTAIDDFVSKAFEWYLGELRKLDSNARYYYELDGDGDRNGGGGYQGFGGGGYGSSMTYKRYKLSDEKTFDSLFFPDKDSLLALINHFTTKTGKYGIKGYPHKLGLLLYGPPGTGKTSLIKALANHTNRSIVNVSLARIKTNADLMNIIFNNNYHLNDNEENGGVPVRLRFKDVIFVMEDVDAASDVVLRRDLKNEGPMGIPLTIGGTTLPAAPAGAGAPSSPTPPNVVASTATTVGTTKSTTSSEPLTAESVIKALRDAGASIDEEMEKTIVDQISASSEHKPEDGTSDEAEEEDGDDDEEGEHQGAVVDYPPGAMGFGGAMGMTGAMFPPLGGMKKKKRKKKSSSRHAAARMGMMGMGNYGFDDGDDSDADTDSAKSGRGVSFEKEDKLNLTGLLNVLDGVVDTPERIVIMTTNHPEMLDPALTRPGRIDKKLLLGAMEGNCVVQMLRHYFPEAVAAAQEKQKQEVAAAAETTTTTTTSSKERLVSKEKTNETLPENVDTPPEWVTRVKRAMDGIGGQNRLHMTPAEIEQLAVEHADLESMVQGLEKKRQEFEDAGGVVAPQVGPPGILVK